MCIYNSAAVRSLLALLEETYIIYGHADSARVCIYNSAAVRSLLALLEETCINLLDMRWTSETYSERCRTSKMELFAKMVGGWKPLALFGKSSIFHSILNTPLNISELSSWQNEFEIIVNILSANPKKWSNTLKQVWVCLAILWSWCLKG